jgi:hypothetical protein
MAALGKAAMEQGFANVTMHGTLETRHFQADEFITRGLGGKVDAAYMAMLQTNQWQAAFLRAVFVLFGIPLVFPSSQ